MQQLLALLSEAKNQTYPCPESLVPVRDGRAVGEGGLSVGCRSPPLALPAQGPALEEPTRQLKELTLSWAVFLKQDTGSCRFPS